ncbi:tRNA uridine-5-carboxymethylaminomethyl(34) synthesis GTPase MnmE [Plebeiibacterium sediminum]|uniref:tRNA modification GTPase MnmE n=1 Tax=Plebeiibacterium sediminum TaxID=2992112 RepID=A0AAE3M7U9_9BACT|nr:tRNA uridine-5-carboxymethylaminomethyl(34) synthesis GTPase MnmE [Plebeiobacterium sediminum]MCW3788155.1 tRNA uridine-5-carboxymethylaminomethyl(34) synthesis GTPase MnmE [Plebeiobacterium sediminum]
MINLEDTIVAVSTAQGAGAIAVIRLTGPDSIIICDKVFKSVKSGKKLVDQSANTVHFGSLIDEDKELDEVLISIFKAPNSFTGENTVEVSCHGAPYIQQKVLELFIKNGANLAAPGEFTQRAFLNGKMDLSQAEAVADLIASRSEAARRVALQQMKGGFSNELIHLRERLLNFISLIELELDFSEEDVEFADRSQLVDLVNEIEHLLSKLINSFSLGNAIKNGIPVAIVGHTNAGKSTLLNTILQEDRAIVSDIHGTTRDVIEDTINIEGITFRFIDTAGIRKTTDAIETIGIDRTFSKIESASIVVLMLDINDPNEKIHEAIADVKNKMNEAQQLIVAINKIDLLTEDEIAQRFDQNKFKELSGSDAIVPLSAKKQIGIELLSEELIKTINLKAVDNDEVIVTNARHYEALKRSHESISRVVDGLHAGISGDFLAQDIREVLYFLGEITGGEIQTDEVLGNIFKNFCIGK